MKIQALAQVCHEVNRAYCQSIRDDSQVPWEEAPDWQKESAVNGVKFQLENPDAPPSALHYSWLKEKLDNGWKYGPEKNESMKTHPCCVPFDELPIEQRTKDYLFSAVVRAILAVEAIKE